MVNRLFAICLTIMTILPLFGKDIRVTNIQEAGNVTMESPLIKNDLNGDKCLLVKFLNIGPDSKFDGAVVDNYYSGDVWYVNLSRQSLKINVKCPSCETLTINLKDYFEQERLDKMAALTVNLKIKDDKNGNTVDGNFISMSVSPVPTDTVKAIISGREFVFNNGELMEFLIPGKYRYEVSAPYFKSESGTFVIRDAEASVINLELKSEKARLYLKCETPQAMVFIDGKRKGNTDWEGELIEGDHHIEVVHPWYKDEYESNITIRNREVVNIVVPRFKTLRD